MKKHPCPSCHEEVEQAGELQLDGKTFPVFQCDNCTELAMVFGVEVEAAYTFCLDENGRVFRPDQTDTNSSTE